MTRYVGSRLAQALLVLLGAYTITYFILYLLPGDPLTIMLTAAGVEPDSLSPEQLAKARAHYGLDRGMFEQYFILLRDFLQGDFGRSLTRGQPVADLILERLPDTLSLAASAILLSAIGGIGFAYLASLVRWRPLERALNRIPSIGFSIPTFWVGLLFIHIFAFQLGWFPPTGNEGVESIVLPAITLAIPSAAVYAQVLLRSFSDVRKEPYIVTAYAKGLTHAQVQARHGFRNAALPVLTLIGLQIGNTASGTVLVETVFARRGIGRLAQEAVLAQDIPVVLAIVILSAVTFVFVNLIVDILYPAFDPRITLGQKIS